MGKIVITTAGISGSAGSVAITGSFIVSGSDGAIELSGSGTALSGAHGASTTTSGSTTFTDAAGSSTSTSATGSVTSGSAGSATHGSGSSTYTDADGTTSTSATGSYTTGSGGSTSTTSGSITIEDAAGGSSGYSASGSHSTGSAGSATHGSGSSTYTDADGTHSTSATGSYTTGSGGSTSTTSGSTEYTDAGGSTTTVSATGSTTTDSSGGTAIVSSTGYVASGSGGESSTTSGSTSYTDAGGSSTTTSATGSTSTGSAGSATHGSGSSTYTSADGTTSTSATGSHMSGTSPGTTTTTAGGTTYEDTDSTTMHSPSGSHYSGSTPVSGTAGSTTVTDGTVEVTGSITVSGSSPAITIMAGELIVSGSSVLGKTIDHVATVGGHLTASYGMSAPTHGISGAYISAYRHDGYEFSGSSGFFAIMSASTFNTHVFAPTTVSASSGQFATLSGSATTVHTLNGLTTTEIALLDGTSAGSITNGKAVVYSNAGGVTANAITASSYTGFRHNGYEFSGSSGFFAIMSASTFNTHVFAPTTVSASSGQFATLSGSAATVHTLNGLTLAEISLLDGASAGSIVASKAVVHDAVGKITGSQVTAFGVTGTLGTFFGLLSASSVHGFSHVGGEAAYTGFVEAGTYMSAATHFTGGHVYAYGVTGSLATFNNSTTSNVLSASRVTFWQADVGSYVKAGTYMSAATHFTGGHVYAYGVTGSLATFSLATFNNSTTSNVLSASRVTFWQADVGSYVKAGTYMEATSHFTGGHVYAYGVTGTLGTFSSVVSASHAKAFRHDGYEFSGSSGFFAIMSASTFTTHVFAPSTVSASSGEFATLSGSATTVHTLNGLTAAEIDLLDGSSAGSIVASKAVIYDAVGKITGSQVTAFGVTGTLGTFFGLLSASSLHGFSHIGGEAVYTGFVEAGTYVSASTQLTGGAVSAYGITGTLGTFFGLLSASSVHGFSHIGGEAVYTGFVEAGTYVSASTHFTGGHVYTYGVTGSQLTLTHEAATPPTYATSQIRLNYDADNFAFIGVDQNGSMTIETTDNGNGALGDIVFTPDGVVTTHQNNAGEIGANTVHGEMVFFGTEDGGDTLAAGKLMYLATGGIWKHADADAVASCGGVMLGIAMGTAVSDGFLVNGYANISGTLTAQPVYKLTHGAALYVSTTAGEMTQTQPTASGDISRVIGYAVSSSTGKVIYFNPSGDWVEQ
jgi:predicted deacetylase